MHAAGEMFGSFEPALDECLVDDHHLGGDVPQFNSLPSSDLLSDGLEASLHSVYANRDAVQERERVGVSRQHPGEHAWDHAGGLLGKQEPDCDRH